MKVVCNFPTSTPINRDKTVAKMRTAEEVYQVAMCTKFVKIDTFWYGGLELHLYLQVKYLQCANEFQKET